MKTFLLRISAVFLLAPFLAISCDRNQPPLNVLFIAVDDMNDWAGALEQKAHTPHIDSLAASGRLFTNAHCVVPACNPSRTAVLSGLRPETTGQYTNAGNFRNKPGGQTIVTLPRYLQLAGYETVAAGKIFHHPRGGGEKPNPLSDTVSWDFQRRGNVGTPGHSLFLDEQDRALWLEGEGDPYITGNNTGMSYMTKFGVWGAIPHGVEECGDWQMAQFCADYLSREHEDPFFLALGIFRPHSPQLVPGKYFEHYPLEEIPMPEVPEGDMEDIPAIARTNWSTPFVELVREKGEWARAVQGYLASMTFADDCVGLVLDALENSRYAENTVVVFWTDHGWQLGHKQRWEKFSLWRQATRTPLVIRVPGQKREGQRCHRAVSLLDLYPTLVELLGLPEKQGLEGESLVPWIRDPEREKETPAVVTFPAGNHSVVMGPWNYIRYSDGSEELYDHRADPGEFINLAHRPGHEERIETLSKWIPYELQAN